MKFTVISKRDHLPNQMRHPKKRHAKLENANGQDLDPRLICLPEWSQRTKRDVIAPPGKLGIILKQGLYGPMIHSVKPESSMAGRLFEEDLIISFNDRVSDALLKNSSCRPLHLNVSTHSKMFIMFLHRMSWN